MWNKEVRLLIVAGMLIALGGLMLHVRIHAPKDELGNWIPVIAGLASLIVVPVLFNYPGTALWGYIITLIIVAVGTIAMAAYSFEQLGDGPITLRFVLMDSTLADIILLFAKVPLALAIVREHRERGNSS